MFDRYKKEFVCLIAQTFVMYILPIIFAPTSAFVLTTTIILTFALSFFLGALSRNVVRYLYSIALTLICIPASLIFKEQTIAFPILCFMVSSLGLVSGVYMKEDIRMFEASVMKSGRTV